jgi:hypothetical protein
MWLTHGSLYWEWLDLPAWACPLLLHSPLLALMTRRQGRLSPLLPAVQWEVSAATLLTDLQGGTSRDT